MIVRRTLFRMTFAVLPALVFCAPTQSRSTRSLTIDDLLAMQRASSPALSPDGRWVAYAVTTPDRIANASSTDLWLSRVDGKTTHRLTTHRAADRNPAWSPDGNWIAFESTRSGASQIWIISPTGGEARQLTTLSTGATQPVWSPDGSRIAFLSEVFPEYSAKQFPESNALNAERLKELQNGKAKAQIRTHLLYRHWDHDVYGKRQHLFIQQVKGGDPRDLTPGDRDAVPTSTTFSGGTDFAFSPDGSELAFTATPLPVHDEAWSTNHDIFTVPADGGVPQQLTTNPAADGSPCYSPDGRFIAFRAQHRAGYEADRWQLMLLDRRTGDIRSLTAKRDASVGTPVWAPDGKHIYFDSEENARTPLFSVSLAGDDVRKIVDGGTNHDLCPARDGAFLLFTRARAVRPPEIYRAGTDGSGLTPVTHLNDHLFEGLDIPEPESIWYAGAGGTRVQAWLFKPPAFDTARKYPLVLMVHGGPQGAWSDGWSYRWNPPLWAAQGYVVIAPNPRGSTGFGQRFTDEISGDWGGKVYVDVMNAVDVARGLPYVDSTRMAAAGASFGGYMVNWILGHAGQRFKALITHDGVYNFESMYGSTDEIWFDEWEHGGTPWEKPEEYRKFSPHLYAGNFRTPTLVIHGALDYRIPETEAMQLFTALQRQNVPSRFLFFPDENHWVLKPANSALWHKTVFEWLSTYLK